MKKNIIATALLIAFATAAQAQFYNIGSANRSTRIALYAGMSQTLNQVEFSYGYYNNIVQAENFNYNPGAAFAMYMSTYRDMSESIRIDAYFGLDYASSSWQADINRFTFSNGIYDLHFENKSKMLGVNVGMGIEYRPTEKIGIEGSLMPYIQFLFSPEVRTEAYISATHTLTPDQNANNWHQASKDEMAMPNFDIGIMGRLAVNYYLTESIWTGLSAEYRQPLVNPSNTNGFAEDAPRGLDYNFYFNEYKRNRISLMLSIGFMFD